MRFWERRRVRKTFEEYVSPEVIALIEKDLARGITGPRPSHFQFVIVVLDDSQPDIVPEIVSRVAEAISSQHAMISNMSASVVVGCLGVPFPCGDSIEKRVKLVDTLVNENGGLIRIAHGQCNGHVGNLGCKSRFVYQAVIPGFNGILRRLLDSPDGTVIEVSP